MELEKLLSQLAVIQQIENLKNQIDSLKPFPAEMEQKILQKFRLDWNYHSNAIEGNPYSYGETHTFILHGITAKGKTMKDHFDVRGHNEGINFILSLVKDDRNITESDIRALHKMILVESYEVDTITPSGLPSKKMILIGDYKKEPNHVKTKTGEIHYYATPENTPVLMTELVDWYHNCLENKEIQPLVIAALFHHKFTEIHPFDDGNGRMARLLMNLILLKAGFPPVVVQNEDKNNYYEALSLADAGEKRNIVEYLGNLLVHSLQIYIKGAKGESIEDESDLDKEIALFKAGLEKEDKQIVFFNRELQINIIKQSIFLLFSKLYEKVKKFDDLFLIASHKIKLNDAQNNEIMEFHIESLNFDNLILNFTNIQNNNNLKFKSIKFVSFLNGYKKSISPKDFTFDLKIIFQNYQFSILFNNKEINILYSENLTENDINDLVSQIIKNIISTLQT